MMGWASWHRNFKVTANFAGKEFVDFAMPWHSGRLPGNAVHKNRMAPALSEKLAANFFKMAHQVETFHAKAGRNFSRMTS
jgi:hypothetical protein